jgi:hypothetical protein
MALLRQPLVFGRRVRDVLVYLNYGLRLSVLGWLVTLPAHAMGEVQLCPGSSDQRKHSVSPSDQTVVVTQVCAGSMDRIMGVGSTSEEQLAQFLQSVNAEAANTYRDLARLYREEAAIEGVNHDIAFAQMLVETNLLSWGGNLSPGSNNFGGISSLTGGVDGASFPSARVGVRAHIQHLKAYASLDPLVQRQVDPRRGYVMRGGAPLVNQLTGRWNTDPEYDRKIAAFMQRLYASAGMI